VPEQSSLPRVDDFWRAESLVIFPLTGSNFGAWKVYIAQGSTPPGNLEMAPQEYLGCEIKNLGMNAQEHIANRLYQRFWNDRASSLSLFSVAPKS
jgi:hypothetical protein